MMGRKIEIRGDYTDIWTGDHFACRSRVTDDPQPGPSQCSDRLKSPTLLLLSQKQRLGLQFLRGKPAPKKQALEKNGY